MSTDFLNSFAASFSDAGIDHILDPLLHQRGDLRCLHIFIVIIVQRFQEVHLHSHRFYRIGVKRFERIDKRHRHDRALRFCCRFEASAFICSRETVVWAVGVFLPALVEATTILSNDRSSDTFDLSCPVARRVEKIKNPHKINFFIKHNFWRGVFKRQES